MKFKPFSTVPAGTLDCMRDAGLVCSDCVGRSCRSDEGERGALKGCAAGVEVAAGLPLGRGLVAVVVCAVTGVWRWAVL